MNRYPQLSAAVRLALLGSAALLVSPAFAQEQDKTTDSKMEEVVVTGSRIVSSNLDSPSPVQTISSEDIQATGILNTQDLLLKNPTFGTPTLSRTNSNFLTSGGGVSTVDLRNLGVDRTLTLVDGRRFVSGNPGSMAVDYNTIPAQFIERIDVLTGGASAVYGSDAVAGVVNIIYKKNFEGVAFDGQYGMSAEDDNEETQFGITLGTNTEDGRGNIMAHVGYTKQGAVYSRDRARSAVDQVSTGAGVTGDPAEIFDITRPFYSSIAPQGRFFYYATPGDPMSRTSTSYDAAGNIIPWNTNGAGGGQATGFNRSALRTIAVPVERYLFAGRGSFEFTENHSAFFEGTYASSNTVTEIEPFPLDSVNLYPATGGVLPLEFDVDGVLTRNPNVPDAIFNRSDDSDGDGLRDFAFTKRMSDFGNRGATAKRDTFRVVGGLQGDLGSESKWHYEGFYSFGQTKEAQQSGGQVNVMNFRNALEAIPDADDLDGDGNTTEAICRDANAREEGCVPVNVFGFNSMSPGAVDYIEAPGSLTTFTRQRVLGLNVSGELFNMPAGPLGIAVGAEYREEFSESEFDALTQAGLNAGNAIPPTSGEYDVREAYLEANVPLLKDLPAVEQLNLRAAVRTSEYSTVGSTLSWNGGIEWSPISSLRFRAIRALSTRAPNINELYSPPSQTFPTGVVDPCVGVTATSTGAVSEACRAAPGVNANIAGSVSGAFTLTQSDFQGISGFDRGNPELSEEEGNSWTIGAVWQPENIPVLDKFDFTVDYYKIDISDAIVQTDRNFILNQCYGGGNQSFCNFITRRPSLAGSYSPGSIEFLDAGVTNSGGEFVEGVDLTVAYAQEVGPGRLNARLSYTHVMDHYVVPLPGEDKDQLAGEVGDSKDRAYLALGYQMGKFGGTLQTTYISAADLDDGFLAAFDLERGALGVGSAMYVDMQLTWQPTESYQVYLGANNLFDEEPPLLISGIPSDVTGTETDAGTYDAIGRRFYAGVRIKF